MWYLTFDVYSVVGNVEAIRDRDGLHLGTVSNALAMGMRT